MSALILLVLLSVVAGGWLRATFNYWSASRIPQITRTRGALALTWGYLTNWRLSQHMLRLYAVCRRERWPCVGAFLFTRPLLFVASPALLREVCVQHEAHFCDRGSYHNAESAQDWNLFNMRGAAWRQWRKVMSGCFAPARMRQCAMVFDANARECLRRLEAADVDVDVFELANRYAGGVARRLLLGREEAFGRDVELASIFRPTWRNRLVDILSYYCPNVLRLCNASEFPRDAFEQVRHALKASLRGGRLPPESFPHHLVDLRGTDGSLREDNVVGVLSALFLGGLKSTTPLITMACYELARNPAMQERLRQEVVDAAEDGGRVPYESVLRMSYMQNVLKEVMRLYTGGPLLIRECNETCTLDSIALTVEKGMLVVASLRGILMDDEYFPNPTHFDPDRFSPSSSCRQDAFLPFGIGRHFCIGDKFALVQAKVFLAHLVLNYQVAVSERTAKLFQDENTRLAANAIYLNCTPIG